MCTVTYVPKQDGFLITSNRDEDKGRIAFPPKQHPLHGQNLYFPQDSLKGGTWIAASEKGHIACLLNGAFEKHIPNPPYRESRGNILLEYFNYHDPEIFLNSISLDNIEPFTLVIFSKSFIKDIRWTGSEVFSKDYDTSKNNIWSSASLYSGETRKKREILFEHHLNKYPDPDVEEMIRLHTFHAPEKEGGMLIERGTKLKTVSITSIKVASLHTEMIYRDLQSDWIERLNIPLIS